MTRYVLDTDTLSLWQRGHTAVVTQILGQDRDSLAVTAIRVEEQMAGRLARIRVAKNIDEIARAYQRLVDTFSVLGRLPVLHFDAAAIQRFEELRSLKLNVGFRIFGSRLSR